jgi:hypothetical protein
MANRDQQWRLVATESGLRPGGFSLGSVQSRAAARSLVNARKERQAEEEWDKEFDPSGLAERLAAARQRGDHEGAPAADWSPIRIPPGKENTVRGRLAARISEARTRVAGFEAERERRNNKARRLYRRLSAITGGCQGAIGAPLCRTDTADHHHLRLRLQRTAHRQMGGRDGRDTGAHLYLAQGNDLAGSGADCFPTGMEAHGPASEPKAHSTASQTRLVTCTLNISAVLGFGGRLVDVFRLANGQPQATGS